MPEKSPLARAELALDPALPIHLRQRLPALDPGDRRTNLRVQHRPFAAYRPSAAYHRLLSPAAGPCRPAVAHQTAHMTSAEAVRADKELLDNLKGSPRIDAGLVPLVRRPPTSFTLRRSTASC